jgi:hypothetical protein
MQETTDQCRLATYGNHRSALAFAEDVRLEAMFFGLVDNRISEKLRQLGIRRSLAER